MQWNPTWLLCFCSPFERSSWSQQESKRYAINLVPKEISAKCSERQKRERNYRKNAKDDCLLTLKTPINLNTYRSKQTFRTTINLPMRYSLANISPHIHLDLLRSSHSSSNLLCNSINVNIASAVIPTSSWSGLVKRCRWNSLNNIVSFSRIFSF